MDTYYEPAAASADAASAFGGEVLARDSDELLRATLAGAGAAAWMWNPVTREFRWTPELPALYGLAPGAPVSMERAWAAVHPDDVEALRDALREQLAAGDTMDLEYRVRGDDGELRWLNTRGRRHSPTRALGITLDITERKRAERLDHEQRRLLELVASAAPLDECLEALTEAIGRLHPGVRAAVLRANAAGTAMEGAISAHFPAAFGEAIRGAPIDEVLFGTCGTAIHTGQAVTCEDIAGSAQWAEPWRALCAAHGIHACYSHPVFVDDRRPVASLFLCLDTVRRPSPWERRIAAFGAHVAGVALARDLAESGLRAERERLRDERERLRAVVEQSVAGIALYDLDGRIIEANARFGAIVGLPVAALLGRRMIDVTHPDDRAISERLMRELTSGLRTSFSVEKRYTRPDGSVVWVRKDANLVRDARGLPQHVASIAIDITEQHRAAERLRLVIDAVPALISFIDRDLRYRLANRAYETWFGKPVESVLGRTMEEVLGAASFVRLRPYIERALAGERVGYDVEAPYASGTRFIHAEYVPVFADDGTVSGFYAFVTDVTAQKRAENVLRDSEERFRAIADSAPAMLWVTDSDNRLSFMSRGWFQYTGQSPEDAYANGLGWIQMVHPDDRDAASQGFLAATAQRGQFELEYRLRRADGVWRWALDAGRPRFDDAGNWLGYVGTVIDVHEQTVAGVALREADRRKDEFLATLAHELRNPLAPIRNALHLLALGTDGPRAGQLHEMLERQVNHMVRLVDDLMEASRISRGKLELRLESLDLAEVLRTAVETSRPLIDRGRHRLDVALPVDRLPVRGDPVRLAQVFANILNNAAKYTDDGGRIEIRAERDGERARVVVRDSGIGIAPEHLPRLFDMFAQLDRHAGRAHGGLGIGLSLAQRLAQMHGGTVTAESAGLGQGSTFTVTLPLAMDAVRPGNTPAVLGQLNERSILVVDDNADAADSLAMLLSCLGADVRVAHNGPDALALAQSWRPAVVLLDLGMPGMDGFEVARRLRADRRLDGLRLIALTGWGQEEDRQRTRAEGFDHHLIKPVDINLLHAVLATVQDTRLTA